MSAVDAESSGEVAPHVPKLPNDVVGEIVTRMAASGASVATNAMLICKHFRTLLLRRATRATLLDDQQVPPFARCLALREVHLTGSCTRLPWNDEDPTPQEPHPLSHLTSLTRIDIEPQRFNVEFNVGSLAALKRCPRLHRLHLAFQTTDSSALRHLLPLTCLQHLFIDVLLPREGFLVPFQSTFDRESFAILSRLVSLQHLDIPENPYHFLPPAASSLAALTALRNLSIPDLVVNDWALTCLSRLTALEHLHAFFSDLKDARVPLLCEFRSLKHLKLRVDKGTLTETGTSKLSSLTGLEVLDIWECAFARGALAQLNCLRGLHQLCLCQCRLRKDALEDIGQLHSLQHLRLEYCYGFRWGAASSLHALTQLTLLHHVGSDTRYMHDQDMKHLCSITTLRDLKLDGRSKTPDTGIDYVSRLQSLESLSVSWWPAVGTLMERLSNLSALTHLEMGSKANSTYLGCATQFTHNGLQALSELPCLQVLCLQGCHIGDLGSECKLAALRKLSLSRCTGFTAAKLACLASAETLEELVLWVCELPADGDLSPLSHFTRLRTLDVPGATDALLKCVCNLPMLSRVELADGEGITNEGMNCLGRLESLKTLHLRCPNITDEGVASLRAAAHLQYVKLVDCCGVTETGLAVLPDRVLVHCR